MSSDFSYWHIAATGVCDGTSAVGESRHRIPRRIRWSTDWTLLSTGLVEGDHNKLTMKEAADGAGISEHQRKQAVRVASVVPGTPSTAICNALPVPRGPAHPLSHGHTIVQPMVLAVILRP